MPFRRGQSGNPGGRPKKLVRLQELERSKTDAALNRLIAIAENEKEPASARIAAATAVLDRGWGRPTQTVAADAEKPPTSEIRVNIVSPGEKRSDLS